MSSKVQELTGLIMALKKILPQGEKHLAPDPFTCLRVHVLEYILEHDLSEMKELSHFLSITPPSATSLVNRLVRAGSLVRVQSPVDRRKVLLRITPKGKDMLTKGKEHIEDHMGKMFSILNNKELDQFITLLKKLVQSHAKNI